MLVPIWSKAVTIWVELVKRKNLLGSLAQFCRSVEVGSPLVLTWTVYMMIPAALTLLQVVCCRASIWAWFVYQRFWVLRPSLSRMITFWVFTGSVMAGGLSGAPSVRACQAQASPMPWLVLPFGVIWSTRSFSAVQS